MCDETFSSDLIDTGTPAAIDGGAPHMRYRPEQLELQKYTIRTLFTCEVANKSYMANVIRDGCARCKQFYFVTKKFKTCSI